MKWSEWAVYCAHLVEAAKADLAAAEIRLRAGEQLLREAVAEGQASQDVAP